MLTAKEIDFVENLYQLHQDKLQEVLDFPSQKQGIYKIVENSILFNEYIESYLYKSYKLFDNAYLLVLKNTYKIIQDRRQSNINSELQLVAIKELKQDYGNIYIRPETFADKMVETFIKTEIDFVEYPKFSSKYYVIAESENQCRMFVTPSIVELISLQKEIHIHISKNVLITKYCRTITEENFESLLNFIQKI